MQSVNFTNLNKKKRKQTFERLLLLSNTPLSLEARQYVLASSWEGVGILVKKFERKPPKGEQSRRDSSFFGPLKDTL